MDNYSSRLFVKDLYDSLIPIIDNNTEKLIIRKSMWDPVIRIYYDYKENSNIDYINSRIINYICK